MQARSQHTPNVSSFIILELEELYFLVVLKVTTIFIFVFFTLVVAPAHYYAEDEPEWVAPAVLLSGAVPMIFVAYITSPFVNYIHLRLPNFARNSRELLMRYSKNPPKDAQIDITTMNFVGKPRVTRFDVSELKAVKQRFGVGNFSRDTKKIDATKKMVDAKGCTIIWSSWCSRKSEGRRSLGEYCKENT
ncbi:hypothetical protein EYC84_007080 [Monilinia fructicola]|uniref:Uncharacterized protein n=1 Tax=Monilinia fructicola TaxID=38448 RepID=A0A5M9KAE8_MONFR|nr:hypothetical protein EYC84_007080 [Monilinia fructicola]